MSGLNSVLDDGQGNEHLEVADQSAQVEDHHEQSDVQATGEQAAPPAEQEDEVEKHRKGLEAGISAERARRQAAEARAAELEALLRKQQPAEQQTPAQRATALERPKREQFANQEAYEDALLEYGDKRREEREVQARQQREQQEQETQFWQAVDSMVKRGQTKFADFDVVVNNGLGRHLAQTQQGQALRFALSQSDAGEDVAYHLGKNPAEADRIAAMPPAKMLHAIGVIESKLSVAQTQDDKPVIPQGLTTQRNAAGRFTPAYSGPTPLDDVLAAKR